MVIKRLLLLTAAIVTAILLLLPWWRNHTLLVDFCDYGLVMAAVGRMQLGERPYVDFITPIQTLQYLAAYFAEQVWGARYLSLTYLNAVFISASFWAISALLLKRFGAALAILLAAAVVVASAVQHTIIWYNAMGVVWLAVVACTAAELETERRWRTLKLLVILGALWLCGMTKVTYQISALAFACTFAIRAAWAKETSLRTMVMTIGSYVVFGLVAPVATELFYTGATFSQWLYNVVLLSGRTRTALLGQMATFKFYWQTPHDYYHPLRFTYAGAWGVGLLLAIAGVVAYRVGRSPQARVRKLVTLTVVTGGALICGGVLLATNMEIAYLAGAAWLALACAIALVFREDGERRLPLAYRVVLGIAAVSLLVPAWEAAWKGTRALWGHEPLVRSEMVAAADLPIRFRYLNGMRILPSMHASLIEFAATEDKLLDQGVPPQSFYFVNATEWMVRVVPEARHAGLPLWLASGTTVVEGNVSHLASWLEHGERLSTIFSYDAWDYWYGPLQAILSRDYLESPLGARLRIYERRRVPEPIEFAVATESNVYSQGMSVTRGSASLQRGSDGKIVFGGDHSHQVDLDYSLFRLTGEMVGEFQPTASTAKAAAVFRVYARNGDRAPDAIWEERIELSGGEHRFSRKFAVSTGGRPVTLSMELPDGFHGHAGWRALKSEHSGALQSEGGWPMDRRLLLKHLDEPSLRALFGDSANVSSVQAFGRGFRAVSADGQPTLITEGASEIWFRTDHASQVTGEFRLPEVGWAKGAVRVSLVCYKSGRFDVLYRGDLSPRDRPGDRGTVQVHIALPEGMGWIGLVAAPLGPQLQGGDICWRNLHVW